MHLSRFKRLRFAHLPTPLEPMSQLTAQLGGPRLWVKRDDCTGLATGGNKARKLEFLMADALEQGCDSVITQGAVQSNHARQTAAIAARLGMPCWVLLENRTGASDRDYLNNGNVLLDKLFGAHISIHPGGSDMPAQMERLAAELRDRGHKPYVIPGGGSNPIGALGYVNAALELLAQANDHGLHIDLVVHATGSAGTQAGLVTGLVGARSRIPVLGIGVRAAREEQERAVFDLARRTADYIGLGDVIAREDVVANCDYVGDGYGLPTAGTVEAIELAARTEALILDPVYSGKGMAGLIDLIRNGRIARTANVVFLHTGGGAALFGLPQFDQPSPARR